MLRIDTITFVPTYEPRRPPVSPRRRVVTLRRGTAGQPDYREDWGSEGAFPVRFVSTEREGFLTAEQVAALQALYDTGLSFALETDLLKPAGGTPDIYSAFFDTASAPVFTPAIPNGTLFQFDMILLVN